MAEITRKTVLKEMQDMAWNNVFCYSKNYAMTQAKDGMEMQFVEAHTKALIIDQMLEELNETGGNDNDR